MVCSSQWVQWVDIDWHEPIYVIVLDFQRLRRREKQIPTPRWTFARFGRSADVPHEAMIGDDEWHESRQRAKNSSCLMCSTKMEPSGPIAAFQAKSLAGSTAMLPRAP